MTDLEDNRPATVRFAPSPTGHIHIGNARTALFNWLFAKQRGGEFVLRFDDTDEARSSDAFAEAIRADLEWLGISPDIVAWQSKRFDAYGAAAERLKAAGLLYPCYETGEELERRRKLRLARRLPPVYGREALKLTEEERSAIEAEGRKPHWRFLLPNFADDPFETRRTEVHWDDIVRGPQTVDLASMSDPVLIREDGTYLYTLPSVIDDIEMGVTHIIRGDDHVTNTGAQIALFKALGSEAPSFGHHNLLTSVSGEGLSKRSNALSIGSLRDEGFEPMAIASLAVLIGTSESVSALPSMAALMELFRPEFASKSAAKFDPAELTSLNRALVHDLSFDDVNTRLAALGISGERAEAFWYAVRGNIDFVKEAEQWWTIVTQGLSDPEPLDTGDVDFVREAFAQLPPEPWDANTWSEWTNSVKQASGRKGRSLFMPLRLALTGRRSGPELADLLPLIGRAGTLDRQP
ncbi:glutamate--tRNA ligase [Hoeflea prorocentri]|uniref:Glutamate--tRNA ligase n=1 Tax=Hoeflea prorocentri TaxID=1922333 RepID=A0A9X3ZH12_9HYPH|nr:glutamate--tRNA ligase [Hoeflea prorocentri]MCY6380310.1 glutamate--tRNA ligase [Hoeflea prorocentri]MDA5398110.1 glutamate--tRNA ligase [Hoeflea prorocentri]